MDVDISNFEKEDFSVNGFYKALVEDNVDPKEGGRVRVRILGIHSLDVTEAPTENLPWAEPVLPIAHSGGANVQNIDTKPGVAATSNTKYSPTPVVSPLEAQLPVPESSANVTAATTEFKTIPIFKDKSICDSGTGGNFSVPAKGSLIWVFFDGGCHLRPQYFAMATQLRDWQAQKLKLTGDLKDRDAIVNNINTDLKKGVDDKSTHEFTGTAIVNQAKVSTNLKPIDIAAKASDFSQKTRIENITSWTSPGGTTIVSDHTHKNEQLFIIHKGYSHHIDNTGQVVKIVGKTSKTPVNSVTGLNSNNASGVANDEIELNAGLKNVYVVGDYNLFVLSNCNIQCHQNVQINALGNVGVLSRQGNINVLAEQGSINFEATKGSINFKAVDMQFEVDEKYILKSKKLIDLSCNEIIQFKSDKKTISESASIQSISTGDFTVETDASINLNTKGNSNFFSKINTTIDSNITNINAQASILLNSNLVEAKGAGGVNIESPAINIKGGVVNVNGDGTVSVLGGAVSVFGTGTAMLGGTTAVVGGGVTTLTGIITMGIGAVTPGNPANPVSSAYQKPSTEAAEKYKNTEFTKSKNDYKPPT